MKILDENKYSDSFKYLTDHLSPASSFIVAVIHLGKLFQHIGNTDVFGPLKLGVEEHEILLLLENQDAKKPKDIESFSLMQPAKITRALDKLERVGAVRRIRDQLDRRSVRIELTDDGRALLKTANQNFVEAGRQLAEAAGPEAIAQLNEALTSITLLLAQRIHGNGADDEK